MVTARYQALSSLLLLLLPATFAHPHPQIPDEPPNDGDMPVTNLNQFTTNLCTDIQTSTLNSLFDDINHDIPTILNSITQGLASPNGFPALFKTEANIAPVTTLFQRIGNRDRLNTGVIRYSVLFTCVNPGERYTSQMFQYSLQNPDVPAASDSKNNDIFIFPLFWELLRGPSYTQCPGIEGNRALPNDGRLVASQYGTIVHELADKYLHFGESREHWTASVESYSVQDAIDLSAEDSLQNAQNHALLACCECHPYPFMKKGFFAVMIFAC